MGEKCYYISKLINNLKLKAGESVKYLIQKIFYFMFCIDIKLLIYILKFFGPITKKNYMNTI